MKKPYILAFFLIIFVAAPIFCGAQQVDHIFQKPPVAPADTTKFNPALLYTPAIATDWFMRPPNPDNPFPPSKDIKFPFVYRLAAGILQGTADKPFNAPNYGLGVAPPPQFIHHNNITEYELALERIHRYTVGND